MHARIGPRTPRTLPLLVAALLVAAVASTLPVVAGDARSGTDGFTVHDDETVYVVADATGAPRDVIVVSWLRVEGEGELTLLDPGDVARAEALEDDLEPVLVPGGVEWTLGVDGRRDFFYRSDTDRELPISVEARYFLDGSPVEPGKLAGATGRLRIEVTVTNNLPVVEDLTFADADGVSRTEEAEYWIPMLAPVKIDVDGTRFRDIVADAQIVNVTGSTISHTFMAFPQPSETISIEMDGTDIAIEPIVVSVFPKMAGDPDFSIADDLAELREGLDGLTLLSEGHSRVLGGLAENLDPSEFEGVGEAGAGLDRLAEGARELGDGAEGLAVLLDGQIGYLDGVIANLRAQDFGPVTQLPAALSDLADGVSDARDGVDGLVTLLDGQIAYLDAIIASNDGLEATAWALATASPDATTTALATGLSTQGAMLGALRDGDAALGMPLGLTDTRESLAEISRGLTAVAGSLEQLATGAAPLTGLPAQFDALATALGTLRDGGVVQGRQLPGLVTTRAGLAEVAGGIGSVGEGIGVAGTALEPLAELPGMLGDLRAAILAVRDGGSLHGQELPGVSTTIDGLRGMSDGLADGIADLSFGEAVVERMERAADEFDTFLGKPEGATGDVRFLFRLDGIEAVEE